MFVCFWSPPHTDHFTDWPTTRRHIYPRGPPCFKLRLRKRGWGHNDIKNEKTQKGKTTQTEQRQNKTHIHLYKEKSLGERSTCPLSEQPETRKWKKSGNTAKRMKEVREMGKWSIDSNTLELHLLNSCSVNNSSSFSPFQRLKMSRPFRKMIWSKNKAILRWFHLVSPTHGVLVCIF